MEDRMVLTSLTSVAPQLLYDINTTPAVPTSLTNFNGSLLYTVSDGSFTTLFESNSRGVVPLVTGSTGATFGSFVSINTELFFSANDGVHGIQLWESDGTSAGTHVLTNLAHVNPSNHYSYNGFAVLSNLTNVDGTLFFTANAGTTGSELWSSNGTSAGTGIVKDINPGTGSSNPANLYNFNGTLIFSANDGTHGVQLWTSDGTSAGTTMVGDINPGSYVNPTTHAVTIYSSSPAGFTNVNGTLYFSALTNSSGRQLWAYNNSTQGAYQVVDLNGINGSYPLYLTNLNGTLYFSAVDGVSGHGASAGELYSFTPTPGTTTGTTQLVKDINPGSANAGVANITPVGNLIYFTANDGVHGTQLWDSDGTAANTQLVQDINTATPNIKYLTAVDGTLFFSANDGVGSGAHGQELWSSNVTSTGIVADIDPGSASSSPTSLVNVNGTLYFTAANSAGVRELFTTDGSSAGTVPLPTNVNGGSEASTGTAGVLVNGTFYFSANDGVHGTELWFTNGTSAGTNFFDINPGSGSSLPANFTNVNGTLFFTANDGVHGTELFAYTGGTPYIVKDILSGSVGSSPSLLTNFNGELFFEANNGTANGIEPWISNDTSTGTIMLADINTGSLSSTPSSPAVVGTNLFFSANDKTHGTQLYYTNGSAGNYQLIDLNGTTSSSPAQTISFTVNGVPGVVTSANIAGVQDLVFVSANTTNGYTLIKPLTVRDLTNIDGTLYFFANDGTDLNTLWRSDGTSAGTQVVKEITTGTASAVGPITSNGTELFFTANDIVHGIELWESDGLAGSNATQLLEDINPASASGLGNGITLTNVNGAIYFVANDGTHGGQLWESGGTSSSTFEVGDLNVPAGTLGSVASSLASLTANANGTLFYVADDGTHGYEPFVVRSTTPGTLTGPSSSPTAGQSITFTIPFTSSDAGAIPTGTVQFYDNGTALSDGLITLDDTGTATYTTTNLAAGSHSISAVYTGDVGFNGSKASAVNLTVLAATTTTLTDNGPNPSTSGTAVTFTVAVSGSPTDGETVSIEDASNGNLAVGSGTLASGSATISISNLSVGSHELFAVYGGDSTLAGSQSPQTLQTVNNAVTPPTFTSALVNGNSTTLSGKQRSIVKSIELTFSTPVSLATGAVQIAIDPNAVYTKIKAPTTVPTITLTSAGGTYNTTWIVGFTGSDLDSGGSISDGAYDLTVIGSLVTDAYGSHLSGTNPTASFLRIFGDALGTSSPASTRTISNGDLALFRSSLNKNNLEFEDLSTDTVVSNGDLALFRLRLNGSISNFTPTI